MNNAVSLVESQSHLEANNEIDTLLHTNAVVVVKQINNQTDEEHQDTYQTDLGLNGSAESQNITDNFEKSKRVYDNPNQIRYCSSALFTRIHPLTNEKSNRTWLCYSPTNRKIYCFICKILLSTQTDLCHGFYDWKNAKRAIEMHEKNSCHLATTLSYMRCDRDWLEGLISFMKKELSAKRIFGDQFWST
ncbi:zinc finger MYM-type protein 5-like [Hydra vulgaris]|uniref:Zinc finger MYM-type protein 5-like n=1 Tax=Hydra vulgaris TaxID=6087 RepID=A0ABM4DM32_HYDVU